MPNRNFNVSKLKKIYLDTRSGQPRLSMAEISQFEALASFSDLRDHVLGLRYPTPQSDKRESFGWVPTLYLPSERIFRREDGSEFSRYGCWRTGVAENDHLSVFYADVDNANASEPVVTMEQVASNLDVLFGPVPFFMYTSFSHTASKPKFRVVIETDRDITRAEMLKLGMYLNWHAFGQQADLSIYDPGDFVFAPPHQFLSREDMQGVPLDVAGTLGLQVELQAAHPESVASYVEAGQPRKPTARINKAQRAVLTANAADRSVRPGVGISYPDIFHPAWGDLYLGRVIGGSHWETMRSVLGMVWAKNGGGLTYGEMDAIAREIDALDGGYYLTKYGETRLAETLGWLLAQPVEPRAPEWHPILDQEDAGLVIDSKDAECGEGKTRDELMRMARETGRYIYVVPKIENMAERKEEFCTLAGQTNAYAFTIKEAHSKAADLRVPLQLMKIRQDMAKLPAGAKIIIFVTQQAAILMDWSGWNDFEIIFDEVPEVFATYQINVVNHAEILRNYLRAGEEDGKCYRLGLTDAGRELAKSHATAVDDYDAVHYGLTLMLAKENTFLWVRKEDWDGTSGSKRLEFFALSSPMNLKAFKMVRMLGDQMLKSVTANIWHKKYAVDFRPLDFEKRRRVVPTADRLSIRYFSKNRDSSITRFKEGDVPLKAISNFIRADAEDEPVLWTANEKLKTSCELPEADFATPKSHGRNDLIQYKRVAWLAALKASKFEIGSLKEVCGMSAQELTDWREFNSMYQFVMRSILRDFDSAVPVVVYVFSKQQAEYLQGRLGGTISFVPDIVLDQRPRCIDEDGPMTENERNKAKTWRYKMLAAGVSDVRDLPPTKPLSKLDDRMIRLINATAAKVARKNGLAKAA